MSLTDDQLDRARRLLDEGCSYRETARTIGASRTTVSAAFPGRGWTYSQARRLPRRHPRLDRRTPRQKRTPPTRRRRPMTARSHTLPIH